MRFAFAATLSTVFACTQHVPPTPSPSSPIRTTNDAKDASIDMPGHIVESFFGESIRDDHRWLESSTESRAAEWIRGQADTTQRVLDAIPGINGMRSRLRELADSNDSIWDVSLAGGRAFYLRRSAGEQVPRLCVREPGGTERTLFKAPDAEKSALSLGHVKPSPDGRFVAFGVSSGGSEDNTVHIIDVSTGTELPDRIEHLNDPSISWLPGRDQFFYLCPPHFHEIDSHNRFIDKQARLHILRTPQESDKIVIDHTGATLKLTETDTPEIHAISGSTFALAVIYHGTKHEVSIYARPIKDILGNAQWQSVITPDDAVGEWTVVGDQLFVISRRDTPLGRVCRIRLGRTPEAKQYVPDNGKALTDITATRDSLYVVDKDVSGAGVRQISLVDQRVSPLPLPFDGTISALFSDPSSPALALQVQGWSESPRWLFLARAGAKAVDAFPDQIKLSLPGARVEHAEVVSRDGTHVPMTILSRGEPKKDGSNPVMLVGYGAYEVSLRPRFQATRIAWLERGGIIAYAHVRGGGELGRDWHINGMRERKQNSIDDFIACAEHLIKGGYTTSARLGTSGDSAGGLLVGAAMTKRPELFRAVYISSGIVNILRLLGLAIGPANTEEFGTPDTREGFESLLNMDAYQQVHAGVSYPSLLVRVGLNDARVPYWQGAKLVAKVQESSTSGRPVLLSVDDAGHGLVTSHQFADQYAYQFAFYLWQFGLLKPEDQGVKRDAQ